MKSITTSVLSKDTKLQDPNAQLVVDRVAAIVQLALQKAVAHHADPANYPLPPDADSLEQLCLRGFQQLRPEVQKASIAHVMAQVQAGSGERQRQFGELAAVNLRTDIAVATQAKGVLIQLPPVFPGGSISNALHGFTPQNATNVELRLGALACDRVTGLLGLVSDDILLGGTSVDSLGSPTEITPFEVGTFHTGDVVEVVHKIFASLNLDDGPQWPKTYFAVLVLAEKKNGSVFQFVRDLTKNIADVVVPLVVTALGAAIGAKVGSTLGGVIGAAIGAVLGALASWILGELSSDDIFTPVTLRLDVPSPDSAFACAADSPPAEARFDGFNGHYRLKYTWHSDAADTFTVVGAIRAKWDALGGAGSFLGCPETNETPTPDGIGRFNHFQGGSIYWTPTTDAHAITGGIRDKWASLGWETSFLSYPLTDETATPDKVGRFNHFQGGSIYWTPTTDAHEVHGAIRDKWSSLGWERSFLGYPQTDETGALDGVGRFNHFQGGSVFWTPLTGAHEVHGEIRDKWSSLGWERSALGYPISDETDDPPTGGRISKFQHGSIHWTAKGGAVVEAAIAAH